MKAIYWSSILFSKLLWVVKLHLKLLHRTQICMSNEANSSCLNIVDEKVLQSWGLKHVTES